MEVVDVRKVGKKSGRVRIWLNGDQRMNGKVSVLELQAGRQVRKSDGKARKKLKERKSGKWKNKLRKEGQMEQKEERMKYVEDGSRWLWEWLQPRLGGGKRWK